MGDNPLFSIPFETLQFSINLDPFETIPLYEDSQD